MIVTCLIHSLKLHQTNMKWVRKGKALLCEKEKYLELLHGGNLTAVQVWVIDMSIFVSVKPTTDMANHTLSSLQEPFKGLNRFVKLRYQVKTLLITSYGRLV